MGGIVLPGCARDRPVQPVRHIFGADTANAGSRILARACSEAGVTRVPHDLRRSRACALTRASVPQSVAMRLLGHKTASMFLRYDVAGIDDLADAVATAEKSANGTTAVQNANVGAGAAEAEIE